MATSLALAKALALVVALVLSLGSLALAQETRTVIDSLGQPVVVPKVVTKVAPVIPAFAQVAEMLTRGAGKVVAYPTAGISDYMKKVFPDLVRVNPKGYDSRSMEDVIASGAQVVYGPVGLMLSDSQKTMYKEAGISVVAVNGLRTVEEMSQSFAIIGDILGEVEAKRAQEFVQYYKGNVAKAARLSSQVPQEKKLRVLFLYGSGGGYRTINKNDISHHYLTAAGGINLAADYLANAPGMGGTIDKETIVNWDPEVIFSSSPVDRLDLLADTSLAVTSAVQNGRVYACPKGIFVWFARSAEGALMPLWLGTKLYPDIFKDVDMKDVVRDYFANFYNYRLPNDELSTILNLTEAK
ncbi:MAG: ABC transporter substrate-binding protein [Deltaproteobacteria bacterium]|nr:ABC transporter substrate-binding protein [Deltaproteobacteria bacterium]